MLKQGQSQRLGQKQSLQQKLSPQQIQYIKLLQLPTIGLEQRVKEELELNPILEEAESEDTIDSVEEIQNEWEMDEEEGESDTTDPVDKNEDIDWDSFLHNTEYDGQNYSGHSSADEEWRDLPNRYYESFLEDLENQVSLLDLDDTEILIADQILGSLDEDGYFRREPEAVVDNISFNHGVLTNEESVEAVRKKIQQLEPIGIASKDLRDCLLVQLKMLEKGGQIKKTAIRIIEDEWSSFERKHFDKLQNRLGVNENELKEAFELIKNLDPRPGAVLNPEEDSSQYIEPDFEVYFSPENKEDSDKKGAGEFVIKLNQRNVPPLRISQHYKEIWDSLKNKDKKKTNDGEAKSFIKDKIESAQWFIESIRQRQKTLLDTMRTIVALQEDFFKYGEGLKPMILKDIAERVNLDISTISRVVNGKYVQTVFGVFELKYFFSEGLQTESGEEVSSYEVKNLLEELIKKEDKSNPLSDQRLTKMLQERGYKVARRTVSKYRERLNLPVARLRKQLV